MFACVLACTTASARVLIRMAHGGLLPKIFERTSSKHCTPGPGIALAVLLMFGATAGMQLRSFTGSDMYDLFGSLAVFGFLTAYALVAVALPFARRASGQRSFAVTSISIFTVLVVIMIAVFDLRSTADEAHARIPYVYLTYIGAGVAWYALRKKRSVVTAA
jgi:amino acid transporter